MVFENWETVLLWIFLKESRVKEGPTPSTSQHIPAINTIAFSKWQLLSTPAEFITPQWNSRNKHPLEPKRSVRGQVDYCSGLTWSWKFTSGDVFWGDLWKGGSCFTFFFRPGTLNLRLMAAQSPIGGIFEVGMCFGVRQTFVSALLLKLCHCEWFAYPS